ncbi:hypothetical protein C7M61_000258 [Candidozyma pseudohaemuli]|uniref:Uncharacterized protein n=1 Tax=Candidozyma pseudohaemuli TaxID=418784 RepID=A0A2P7YXA8_9ASCO|nr:hypothetical protein C7M61_000258 [[Candida] pseudohaemulonii]PSK40610.1 hypothetical protein C7M61_000258 [[Candida] pseudohaemulonii]
MRTIKLVIFSVLAMSGVNSMHPGNFSSMPSPTIVVNDTSTLTMPQTTMTTSSQLDAEETQSQPAGPVNRLKSLKNKPIDLQSWINLYHVLYPQEKVQKAKNVVKQRYMAASKLVLKESVKGLIMSIPPKLDSSLNVSSFENNTINSTSLLRTLLGKDLESESDGSEESDSCSGSEDDLDSDSESDCEEDKYSWDYDYESWSKYNRTGEVPKEPEAPKQPEVPKEAEVKKPRFNFTNYTVSRPAGRPTRPPAVIYPEFVNHTNSSIGALEEANAAQTTSLSLWGCLLPIVIHQLI